MEKVLPSYDYANFSVDYLNKRVKYDYPFQSPQKTFEFFQIFIRLFVLVTLPVVSVLLVIENILLGSEQFAYACTMTLLMTPFIAYLVHYTHKKYGLFRAYIIKFGFSWEEVEQIKIAGPAKTNELRIKNIGNYYTEYFAWGDYNKQLTLFEIKCVKLKIEKKKWGQKIPIYTWEMRAKFKRKPKNGHLIIYNQVGGLDETKNKRNGDKRPAVVEFI